MYAYLHTNTYIHANSYSRSLTISYLDEDLLIVRDQYGAPDVLKRAVSLKTVVIVEEIITILHT